MVFESPAHPAMPSLTPPPSTTSLLSFSLPLLLLGEFHSATVIRRTPTPPLSSSSASRLQLSPATPMETNLPKTSLNPNFYLTSRIIFASPVQMIS